LWKLRILVYHDFHGLVKLHVMLRSRKL